MSMAPLSSAFPRIRLAVVQYGDSLEARRLIRAGDAACALLDDPRLRQRIAEQALEDFTKELSIESTSRKVDPILGDVLA
jgi:hypothetical protein